MMGERDGERGLNSNNGRENSGRERREVATIICVCNVIMESGGDG